MMVKGWDNEGLQRSREVSLAGGLTFGSESSETEG